MKKLFVLLGCLFLLSGCYNHRELNDLAICSGVGVSYENNEYVLTLQVVNTSAFDSKSTSNNASFSVYTEKGKTIFEAINKISKELSKEITLTQLKVIVIDESAILDNLGSLVDFLMNDLEVSLNVPVVTSLKSNPKDVLSVITPNNEINASYISSLIEVNNSKFGNAYPIELSSFFVDYLTDYNNIMLTNVELKESSDMEDNNDVLKDTDNASTLYIDNPIVFNNETVYKLNLDESIVLNTIENNINDNSLTFDCNGGNFSIMVLNSKFGFSKFENNNIYLNGNLKGTVNEYNCSWDLDDDQTLVKLENVIKNSFYDMIDNAFNKSKELKLDFLEIGKFIYNNYTDEYKKIKDVNISLVDFNIVNKISVDLTKQGNLRGDINE